MLEVFFLLALLVCFVIAIAATSVAGVVLYAALVIWREVREAGK